MHVISPKQKAAKAIIENVNEIIAALHSPIAG